MTRPEQVLTVAQVGETCEAIARQQLPDGRIPWYPGHHTDPWNHVEAAMALAVGGHHDAVERAYAWLRETQRPDGWWPAYVIGDEVTDSTVDANFCAYIAAGLWHHTMLTGDSGLLERTWEVMERAVDWVCAQQRPGGEVTWAVDVHGKPSTFALLTSTAAIHLSLRCAVRCADLLGHHRAHWWEAAERVAYSVRHREHAFEPKERWAMDWYYPVLGGAVSGGAASQRIDERWEEFVVDGMGVRCVSDRPWVTAAETCELVLALDAIGEHQRAVQLLRDVQWLRVDDGAYWTGAVFPERTPYPGDQSTYTAGAVVLAADALMGLTPASGFFRALHAPAAEGGALSPGGTSPTDRCDGVLTGRRASVHGHTEIAAGKPS